MDLWDKIMNKNEAIVRMQEDIHNAELASQLLANPVFKNAFEILDRAVYEAFCATDSCDVDQLQAIRMQQSLLKQLKSSFENLVENGKISSKQLESLTDL